MGHPVDNLATDQRLSGLGLEQKGGQMISQQHFDPIERRFGQRTTMVSANLLPFLASYFANVAQIFILRQRWGLVLSCCQIRTFLRSGMLIAASGARDYTARYTLRF